MKSFRPAAGILAGVLLAGGAATALADQTFSSVSTAPVRSPRPAAGTGAVDIQYVVLPVRRRGHHHARPPYPYQPARIHSSNQAVPAAPRPMPT